LSARKPQGPKSPLNQAFLVEEDEEIIISLSDNEMLEEIDDEEELYPI
jgi:hypothetical protein